MKKLCLMLVSLLVAISLFGCSAPAESSPSQEEYDAVMSENEDLQAQITELQSANATLTSENGTLKADNQKLETQVSDLQTQLEAAPEESAAPSAAPASSPEDGILLVDDEYVTIYYLGVEPSKYSGADVLMYAVNKTDEEITFQCSTLSLDGEDLGHISGSDSIAAVSKGKFSFTTKEVPSTYAPATLTAVIKVIDFSKTLWDKQSYEVKVTNFPLDGSADVASADEATEETVEE